MIFIDRKDEYKRITSLLDSAEGSLCCVYGRRRCGKTRLLRECLKERPHCIYFMADRSESISQISRFVRDASIIYPVFKGLQITDWGQALDLWLSVSPQGAILVLDEFPYLVEKEKAFPSILQRICDLLQENGHKIIICGSSQRMMQGFVLNQSEPLYGRAREILPIRPIPFKYMKEAFPGMSSYDRLKAWGVWGGVPRYWELQENNSSLWSTVRQNVTSPLGVLHNEQHFLLLDEVDNTAQASTVLSFIGDGVHRLNEIASRMNRPATDLSRPLQRLLSLGMISRDTPFGEDAKSKRSYYRIADPFLNFWYTFVHPNWSRDDFLETAEEQKAFDEKYSVFLGGVWEELVRDTILHKGIPEMSGPARTCRRWWGTGVNRKPMELDVLAESSDGRTLLVGEAKLALTEHEAKAELEALKSKALMLPFVNRYNSIIYKLFVARNPPQGALSLEWIE